MEKEKNWLPDPHRRKDRIYTVYMPGKGEGEWFPLAPVESAQGVAAIIHALLEHSTTGPQKLLIEVIYV